MSFKTARSRAEAAYDLETLLGVVNLATAPATRSAKRPRGGDHAIAVVPDRAGMRRKARRR